jgi:hypothetical protein
MHIRSTAVVLALCAAVAGLAALAAEATRAGDRCVFAALAATAVFRRCGDLLREHPCAPRARRRGLIFVIRHPRTGDEQETP